MKKRFVCALLTLILLVGLVPATALNVGAATLAVSENAITVLKQLEGYSQTCDSKGYTGYGTLCTGSAPHGSHKTTETKADAALRTELKSLDAAVNSFASKQGLTLTQGKHDALVLFSFQNGTAWMNGTGEFRAAVVKGLKGTDFLNAICSWNSDESDDDRRMIEANMYLYSVYSSSRPSKFIRVYYQATPDNSTASSDDDAGIATYEDTTGSDSSGKADDIDGDTGFGVVPEAEVNWPEGTIAGAEKRTYYYDVTSKPAPHMTPSAKNYTFTGWYVEAKGVTSSDGKAVYKKVTTLTASNHGDTLVGGWARTTMNITNGMTVNYLIDKSQLLSKNLYVYQDAKLKPYTIKDKDGKTVGGYYEYEAETLGDETPDAIAYTSGGVNYYRDSEGRDYYIGLNEAGDRTKYVIGKLGYDVVVEAAKFVEAKDSKKKTIPASTYYVDNTALRVDMDLLDESGTRWCRVADNTTYWVKVSNKITTGSTTTSTNNSIDLTVSVVSNLGYVNRRESASIYSNKNGSYTSGTKLRIVDTASKDGFLWGKVAKDTTSTDGVGWIALMYTDYETVRQAASSAVNTGKVIGSGFITYKGYVNVRSDAGTDNEIVGALYNGTEFKLYQTKFVNGIEWGLCDSGWLCLTYANVTRTSTTTSSTSDVGFTSYAFTGTLLDDERIFDAPGGDYRTTGNLLKGTKVTITNLVYNEEDGYTWGKFSGGWVMVTNDLGEAADVKLDVAKFTVTSELTVRKSPNTSAQRIDTLSKGVEFNVNGTKQIMVVGDTIWGYADKVGEDSATYGGWVNLANKYVTRGDAPITVETDPYAGKVATIVGAETVRVRNGASLSGKVIGSIKQGTTVNILGEENGWFKINYNVGSEDDSWVYGQYVEVKEGTANSTGSTSASNGTGVGIIANTYGGVNVRATPGVGGTYKGKILPGTQVNILETKTVGSAQWGRVEQGWICMDYVQIISDLPADVLAALGTTNGTTGSNGSSTTTGAEKAIYTGTVKQDVNVRKETSLDSDVVREVKAGENITMHEILEVVTVTEDTTTGTDSSTGSTSTTTTTKTTTYWARVNDGYIYNPAGHIDLDTLDEATYTVTGSETLNVRSVPGTGEIIHRLSKGAQVKVTKLQIVNGNVWGYIESTPTDPVKTTDEEGNTVTEEDAWTGEGWISLAYTTKGAVAVTTKKDDSTTETTPTESTPVVGSTGNTGEGGYTASGYKYKGTVINTDSLRVRNTASTGAKVNATLKRGSTLYIYETCIAEDMAWGRCDAGWVYLYYVDMSADSLADVKVVYNDNTIAYTDVNCSEVAGTYRRMAVIEVYEIVGNMYRTDLGWVSKDNLLS